MNGLTPPINWISCFSRFSWQVLGLFISLRGRATNWISLQPTNSVQETQRMNQNGLFMRKSVSWSAKKCLEDEETKTWFAWTCTNTRSDLTFLLLNRKTRLSLFFIIFISESHPITLASYPWIEETRCDHSKIDDCYMYGVPKNMVFPLLPSKQHFNYWNKVITELKLQRDRTSFRQL